MIGFNHGAETSADGLFHLTEAECLGACVNAPMMQVHTASIACVAPHAAGCSWSTRAQIAFMLARSLAHADRKCSRTNPHVTGAPAPGLCTHYVSHGK